MTKIESALCCLSQNRIPLCGACRFSPDLVLPNVRSVSRLPNEPKTLLIGLFPYYTGRNDARNLSLYSVIPDYHDVAGAMLQKTCDSLKALFPEGNFVPFVDASPIDEITAAVRAGLGVRGRNNQLITEQFGSMVFIGEIVTDMDFDVIDSAEKSCENCGICVKACPTGALAEKEFDKSRCRSHFSQKKGELTEWESEQLKSGGLVWGCDICTLACPHNSHPQMTPIEEFLTDVVSIADEDNLEQLMKNRAFAWRGEKVMRRNMSLLK